jgi:uncharacterized protein (TIGR02466 family)
MRDSASAAPRGIPQESTMPLAAKEMFQLFPTGLFTGKLPDVALCDRIEKKLYEMQKANLGVTAKTYLRSYMTPDNLQTMPEFKELSDLILEECANILDIYKIKRDSHYISAMWANITSPNRRHNTHTHPNGVLSGLLYVRTPPGCGQTVFLSPLHLMRMIAPDLAQKNEFNAHSFVYPIEKGRMILWQAHLPHAVDNGNADDKEDRIVVAFNVNIRGKVTMETAKGAYA